MNTVKIAIAATAAAALILLASCGGGGDKTPESGVPELEAARVPEPEAASGSFTDERDGRKYRTVKIGKYVWMAENLNYKADKSPCYDNDDSNCGKYGRLYDWNTALKACPAGWHLPNNAEWADLDDFVGKGSTVGNKLKAKGGWSTCSNYIPCSDAYGFSALPGGYGAIGHFRDAGNLGLWWSTREDDAGNAVQRNISSQFNILALGTADKKAQLSVRCVQDDTTRGENCDKTHKSQAPKIAHEPKTEHWIDSGSFTDARDGRKYRTVRIGNEVWMAENLNFKADSSWCFDNNDSNCIRYGRLYNWYAAMEACPAGWRLPGDGEWKNLAQNAGGREVAAKKLKSKTGWGDYYLGGVGCWGDPNPCIISGDGTDEFGFSAMPGRERGTDGKFWGRPTSGYWWSASDIMAGVTWIWSMDRSSNYMGRNYRNKSNGFSVRCVRE